MSMTNLCMKNLTIAKNCINFINDLRLTVNNNDELHTYENVCIISRWIRRKKVYLLFFKPIKCCKHIVSTIVRSPFVFYIYIFPNFLNSFLV